MSPPYTRAIPYLTVLALALLPGIAAAEPAAPNAPGHVLSITVTQPAPTMPEAYWQAMEQAHARPHIISLGSAPSVDAPYDYSSVEEDIATFAERGMRPSVFLTSHIFYIPTEPQRDQFGTTYTQRQNPFDPTFLREWSRKLREVREIFGDDKRIERIYPTPPSFYGEGEYYMGPDWAKPKILVYDKFARARFVEWLQARYDTPEAVADSWGEDFGSWDNVTVPPYPQATSGHVLDNGWLDLMEWRTDYIGALLTQQLHALAGMAAPVTYMCSIGDYSAIWGSNSGRIIAECADIPGFAWHMTNSHSLPDLKYLASMGQHYGLDRLVTENNGFLYGRSEIAKSMLNCLMTGIDEFNFSYDRHLVLWENPSEISRVLVDAQAILSRYDIQPPRKEIAFLHSKTTARVRVPTYTNRDVSHAYDGSLASGGLPEAWGFSWARFLDQPDVVGERMLLDGGLEGRRLLILPNTSLTVLPTKVREALFEWVEAGGWLVAFGSDALAHQMDDLPQAAGLSRCRRLPGWDFPDTTQSNGDVTVASGEGTAHIFKETPTPQSRCPVWNAVLPSGWRPLLTDSDDRVALAEKRIGQNGRIILFPQPVPPARGMEFDAFYESDLRHLLRGLAQAAGCEFPFTMRNPESNREIAPMAVGYVGRDGKTSKHLFVAGSYDDSTPTVRFETTSGLSGPSEMILIDLPRVQARAVDPKHAVRVTHSRPSQYELYRLPTSMENRTTSLIPYTVVEFEAGQPFLLGMTPDP